MRVALFVTCLNDTAFPETGIATVRILERLGHTVEFPFAQTCCGQLHFNSGYQDEALALSRRFVRVFSDAEVVVAPSASCVAMVREFYPYLARQARDETFIGEVEALASRVLELTEFLAGSSALVDLVAAFPHRVTYHPTCHSLRILEVGDAPLALLERVGGIDLVVLPRADECCGFGAPSQSRTPTRRWPSS